MSDGRTLVGVQFLRGFCALAVVVSHTATMVSRPKYFGEQLLSGALEYGFFGVDIFFVISAYIISIVALRPPLQGEVNGNLKPWSLRPRVSIVAFVRRRFARIVPLMWIAILAYASLQLMFARLDIDIAAYFRAMLLLPYSYVKPDMVWTLRHEFLFYIAFSLSFLTSRGLRIVLVMFIFSPIIYGIANNSILASTGGVNSAAATIFSAVNLEFGAGLILGLVWLRMSPRAPCRLLLHPFWILGMATLAVMSLGAVFPFVPQSVPSTGFMGILGAGLVALAARSDCPPGRLSQLGELLGNASYAIYLFHLHVVASVLAVWSMLLPRTPAVVVVMITVVGTVFCATGIHVWIERPLVRWTRNRLERSSLQVAA